MSAPHSRPCVASEAHRLGALTCRPGNDALLRAAVDALRVHSEDTKHAPSAPPSADPMSALVESEALYRQIVNAAYEGVWLLDLEGRTIFVNQRTADLFGYTRDEMMGQSLFDFMDPPERAEAELRMRRRRENISEEHEFRFRHKSGAELWTHIAASPLRDDAGKIVGALGMLVDITPLKRAEATLSRNAAELRILFEGAAIGIALVDERGRPLRSNPALQRMLGYSADELSHMSFAEFTHPDDVASDLHLLERMARGDISSYQLEKRFLHRDGHVIWGRLTASVMRAEGERVLGIGMVEDVTDKKRLEAQFHTAQRMESLGTLAGGIAHDFNNILAAIVANVELAASELDPRHPLQVTLAEIELAGTRAAALVRQILTFSQRGTPERRRMRLESAAGEAIQLLRATVPAQVSIQASFSPGVPEILADPTQVHQVVMNLGTNAMHAMSETGGVLGIRTEAVTLTAPLQGVHGELSPGTYAKLSVTDTGSGIEPEVAARIFDPFFTTKGAGKGSGLGLAVVHGVMRAHHGDVVLESTPGKGSRFDLYFPVTTALAPESRPPRIATDRRGKGQRIICIDDEEPITRVTTLLLKRVGYDAVGFNDPRQALNAIAESPTRFDLVVSDCSMPVIWGLDFVRELRRLRSDLPIVMTSGLLAPELEASLRELGVREFVAKPATLPDLSAAIARALGG